MIRNVELIDRVHELRDLIRLLDMASMSVGGREDRAGLQRGMYITYEKLDGILAIIDPEDDAEEGMSGESAAERSPVRRAES